MTSTYFEGVADPAIAERGYSRDHRPRLCAGQHRAGGHAARACRWAMRFSPATPPMSPRCNRSLRRWRSRFGKVNRVWVMDRGMVSAENIAWLNATGRRYVIGTARAELKRFSQQSSLRKPIGARSAKMSKSRSAVDLMEARPSCCVVRRAAWRKRRRCMNGSPSGSKKALQSLARRIEKSKRRSTVASSNARSGGCWKKLPGGGALLDRDFRR